MVSAKILLFTCLIIGGSCLVDGLIDLDGLLGGLLGGGKGSCSDCKTPKDTNELVNLWVKIGGLIGVKANVGLDLRNILSLLIRANIAVDLCNRNVGKSCSYCTQKHNGKGPWRGLSKEQIIKALGLTNCRSQLDKYRKQREGKMTDYENNLLSICLNLLDILELNVNVGTGQRYKKSVIQICLALGHYCRNNTNYNNDKIKDLLRGLINNCNTHMKKHNLGEITQKQILSIFAKLKLNL